MGTYAVGDLHACYDALQEMLKKIGFSEEDRLILVGDYVDRGPQNIRLLNWLYDRPKNVIPLMGNHDHEFAAYVRALHEINKRDKICQDYDEPAELFALYEVAKVYARIEYDMYFDYYGTLERMAESGEVTMSDLIRWQEMIETFPYFFREDINGRDCVAVHGGFAQNLEGLPTRYKTLESFYIYAREEGIKYGGVKDGMVVFGHSPTIAKELFSYNHGNVFKVVDKEKNCVFYDIDCGCVFKGYDPEAHLACIRLEDEKIWYV